MVSHQTGQLMTGEMCVCLLMRVHCERVDAVTQSAAAAAAAGDELMTGRCVITCSTLPPAQWHISTAETETAQ